MPPASRQSAMSLTAHARPLAAPRPCIHAAGSAAFGAPHETRARSPHSLPVHERFHGELDGDVLHELSQRRDGRAFVRAALQVGVLVASASALLVATAPVAWWSAFAAQVLAQFAMFGLLHESTHGTAFASARWNQVARWVAAVWQFAPPAWMRAFHFQHHRHTHELAADPELGGMTWMARWPRGVAWLLTVSGLPILIARLGITLLAAVGIPALLRKALPYATPAQHAAIRRDARILVLVHAGTIVAAATVVPAIGWLYVAAVAAHAILSAYLTCEHRGLAEHGDILQRTRSIRAGWLLRWLLWNMPYHAEHHAYPSVPFHALPRLHRLLAHRLPNAGRSVLQLHLARAVARG
jgi:fatty acid desaturase